MSTSFPIPGTMHPRRRNEERTPAASSTGLLALALLLCAASALVLVGDSPGHDLGPAPSGEANPGSSVFWASGVPTGSDPAPDDVVPVDEFPILVHMPTPVYPDRAREARIEGTVLLRILISEDGTVKSILIDDGVPSLSESAVAAAQAAIFRPALRDGRPVAVWVALPVKFTLD